MKKFCAIIAFVFTTSVVISKVKHTVVRGDTLWDISAKYYNDPWRWRVIWEINKSSIADPHWIYPGQIFIIPEAEAAGGSEEVISETAETATSEPLEIAPNEEADVSSTEVPSIEEAFPTEEVTTEKELVISSPAVEEAVISPEKALPGKSFIVPLDWSVDGYIIGDAEQRLLISQGDIVYLDIGTEKGIKPKMQYYVYHKEGLVVHPLTGAKVGYRIRKVGLIEITSEIELKVSTAKVVKSYDVISVGDMLKLR